MTYPTKEEKAADIEKSGRITFFYSLTTQSSLKIQFATFFTYLHSFLIFLQVVARESNNFFVLILLGMFLLGSLLPSLI